MVYAIVEEMREWLVDHNFKGSDESMHSDMMRREKERERAEERLTTRDADKDPSKNEEEGDNEFDGSTNFLGAVRELGEGEEVSLEAFLVWKVGFDQRVVERGNEEANKHTKASTVGKTKDKRREGRKLNEQSGRQWFMEKKGEGEGEDVPFPEKVRLPLLFPVRDRDILLLACADKSDFPGDTDGW